MRVAGAEFMFIIIFHLSSLLKVMFVKVTHLHSFFQLYEFGCGIRRLPTLK